MARKPLSCSRARVDPGAERAHTGLLCRTSVLGWGRSATVAASPRGISPNLCPEPPERKNLRAPLQAAGSTTGPRPAIIARLAGIVATDVRPEQLQHQRHHHHRLVCPVA